MVTSKKTLQKIRDIIEKHYSKLIISFLGKSVLSERELAAIKAMGVNTDNPDSMLELIYYHNFINNPVDVHSPTSVEDMKNQQSVAGLLPQGEAHEFSIDNLNESAKTLIEKMKIDSVARIEGIVRENNSNYKFNALQHLDRTSLADEMVKESSLGKVKQKLRDSSKNANRDWTRVALTEMSNAIGIGSTDRIVSNNSNKDLNNVYVFRIPVNDVATCKWCKKFYIDSDGTPKVYRLSTLLSNGTNYGKPTADWRPVTGATHPNTRTSQIIELKPGFAVQAGGSVTYIGMDKWNDYIVNKLES
jgi:hypothetical protein